MNSIIAEDKKVKQKQHQQNRAIKELLQEGQVRTLVDKHDPELKAIFKHYSELAEFKIEKTIKSLDVKGFSTFVKQYGISPELLKLQNCLVVYKHTLREHNVKEGLNYQQFLEILVRLASKSSKLLVKSTSHPEQSPGDNEFDREQNAEQNEEEVTSLSPQIVERTQLSYLRFVPSYETGNPPVQVTFILPYCQSSQVKWTLIAPPLK